jgi:hypothetical protein
VIAHLVLFRPRADLTAQARAGLADALSSALGAIPSIRRASIGRRVRHGRPYELSMRADYSHAALLEFDDLAGLQAYLDHPAHGPLASRFFDAFEDALMYDYEMMEGEAGVTAMRAGIVEEGLQPHRRPHAPEK